MLPTEEGSLIPPSARPPQSNVICLCRPLDLNQPVLDETVRARHLEEYITVYAGRILYETQGNLKVPPPWHTVHAYPDRCGHGSRVFTP